MNVEPYLIRSRLFGALGVPPKRCPILHAWAIVENRKFCHEFMGELLCREGSEKAIRLAVGRELDALRLFLNSTPYVFGTIKRGGGKDKEITSYGALSINRAVSWIQEQITQDPDAANPFVVIDRYLPDAIALHIPRIQEKGNSRPLKKRDSGKRKREGSTRNTLGLTSVLLSLPNCTLRFALEMARLGLPVFPAHGLIDGVCSCRLGTECKNPGKHPCIARWRQVATCYEPSLVRLWEKFPLANVGIATGCKLKNGEFLTVIDCDFRHFGHGSLSHLERNELCLLPPTREHNNGGGPHKFYSYPRGFHSGPGALGQGIDIQSFGKFVIAPGSTHKSGRVYEVTADLPIARLPDDWATRIDAIRNKALPLIPEGQRRANLISWAGGMVASGMDRELIFATLRDRRDRRCEKGSHSFSDEDLRGMISYCSLQEGQRKKEQAA